MVDRETEFYKLKTWCDAKDGLGVWRLSRVKKRQKHKVLVYFDGWSDRWKQWHCIHSNMIAPIRMNSKGYTGQAKVALREWDFNEEYLNIVEGKIKIMLHNKFEGFDPYGITVLLRGDLFVLVDCLLTYTYNDPSKDIPRVSTFFALILDLIIKWMQVAPEVFANQQRFAEQSGAYLLNTDAAIYKSGYELLESFNSIMGNNPRTKRFYERRDLGANPSQLVQTFIKKQGVNAVTSLLTSPIPLQDIWHLIAHFPKILLNQEAQSLKKSVTEFCDALFIKIGQLAPGSEETLDSTLSSTLSMHLEGLFRQVYSQTIVNERIAIVRGKLGFESLSPVNNPPLLKAPNLKKQLLVVENMRAEEEEKQPPLQDANKEIDFMPDPEGTGSDNLFEEHSSVIVHESEATMNLKSYVDLKFKECMDAIAQSGAGQLQANDYRLQDIFQKHSSCDQQEFAVLSALETLLTENDIPQALKLLRWRKKVLKVAGISGWEAAQAVARKTVEKLEVTAMDLIEGNLKAWSFATDQSLRGQDELGD